MARAEPAAVLAAVVTGFLAERDAAEVRADADDDKPFRFLDAVGIGLRFAQLRDVDILRGLDLLGRAMRDKDRLALPAGATNAFNFVIASDKPFTSTNLTAKVQFNRVVLEGGKLADVNKDVKIE